MESSTRNLTFLLSLGALPLACDEAEPDDSAEGGVTSTATDPSTSSDTTDTTPTSAGTMSGGSEADCQAYVAWALMCDPTSDPAETLALCEEDLHFAEVFLGPKCVALYHDALACLVSASCAEADACISAVDTALDCLPDPGSVCQLWGVTYAECFPGPYANNAAGECQLYINQTAYNYGAYDAKKLEDYFACMSGLSCAELESDAELCPL